jgi:glucose-1-phosphate cytidylyltransferase
MSEGNLDKSRIKTIILSGGLGIRLREETEFRPKPLVQIGGRPIIWHIMKIYAHYGFKNFLIALGHKGEMIKDYFLNYEAMNNDFTISLGRLAGINFHGEHEEQDFKVTLADTGSSSMTGARVKRLERYLTDDLFMVTYGDRVADIDLSKLLRFHMSHGKLATATVVPSISRLGVIDVRDNGQVKSFSEKSKLSGWVSAGFFVFDRRVLDLFSSAEECVLEKEPLERLAAKGELMSFQHPGCVYALDTDREYQLLNEMWDNGEAPWRVWDPTTSRPSPNKGSEKRPRRGTGTLQLIKNGGKPSGSLKKK